MKISEDRVLKSFQELIVRYGRAVAGAAVRFFVYFIPLLFLFLLQIDLEEFRCRGLLLMHEWHLLFLYR